MSAYNAHSEPLFKKLKILKYEDLLLYNTGIFMFNVTLGTHPPSISEIFKKGVNFSRNLEFILPTVPFSYLQKIVPYRFIDTWNRLHRGHKDWAKEKPTNTNRKIGAPPRIIPTSNNLSLNKYRLNGFKNSLADVLLNKYKVLVKCKNAYCLDCN